MHGSGGVTSSDDSLQSDRSGFSVLAEQLDTEVIENMINFWIEDWAIE
jgi:hypothetical protein